VEYFSGRIYLTVSEFFARVLAYLYKVDGMMLQAIQYHGDLLAVSFIEYVVHQSGLPRSQIA